MVMRQLLLLLFVVLAFQAKADDYRDMKPMTLETPEMKAELVDLPEQNVFYLDRAVPSASPKMDFDFFKSKTNPGVKPYKFMDDMTFVGIPCLLQAGPSRAIRVCSASMPRRNRVERVIPNF